jgi:hypothetical protein
LNQEGNYNTANIRRRSGRERAGHISRLFAAAVVLAGWFLPFEAYSNPSGAQFKEYEVKAAFIYNFLKFVDWPEEKAASDKKEIVIGIVGEDPFGSATDIFKDKTVGDNKVVLQRFEGIEQIERTADREQKFEMLKACHLLFICPSEQKRVQEIIKIIDKHSVLTVGDAEGFIESGGIINFLMEGNKIRFDINQAAAEKAGLKIRSQLLRLAKRVVQSNEDGTPDATTQQEGN